MDPYESTDAVVPTDPGPTAEAQLVGLAGAVAGTTGRRRRAVAVAVAVVLVAGLGLAVATIVQALA